MLTEGDLVGKPSKGTKKDRRLKANKKKSTGKKKGSGSAKKLNKRKSAAFNKIGVY